MKKSILFIIAILAISLSTVLAGSWSASITSSNNAGVKIVDKYRSYAGLTYSTYHLSADAYCSNYNAPHSYADCWASVEWNEPTGSQILQVLAATPNGPLGIQGILYNGWYTATGTKTNITASYVSAYATACSGDFGVTASSNAYVTW
jgi:hypothetical protein